MEAYPIPNQEARTVARKITDEFFFRFSPPDQLHSNQGRQFESELMAEVCRLLGIHKTRTTPYHPQSDGLVERYNRTLLSMLATAASDNCFEWEDHLRPLCMAYNTSINPTTGFSPFYLMFGRQAHMPIDVMYGSPSTAVSSPEHVANLRTRLESAYQRVREQMGHKLDRQKTLYDRRVHGAPIKEGDLVWLHSIVIPRGQVKKFHCPW
jgi:transposase InsO family protein